MAYKYQWFSFSSLDYGCTEHHLASMGKRGFHLDKVGIFHLYTRYQIAEPREDLYRLDSIRNGTLFCQLGIETMPEYAKLLKSQGWDYVCFTEDVAVSRCPVSSGNTLASDHPALAMGRYVYLFTLLIGILFLASANLFSSLLFPFSSLLAWSGTFLLLSLPFLLAALALFFLAKMPWVLFTWLRQRRGAPIPLYPLLLSRLQIIFFTAFSLFFFTGALFGSPSGKPSTFFAIPYLAFLSYLLFYRRKRLSGTMKRSTPWILLGAAIFILPLIVSTYFVSMDSFGPNSPRDHRELHHFVSRESLGIPPSQNLYPSEMASRIFLGPLGTKAEIYGTHYGLNPSEPASLSLTCPDPGVGDFLLQLRQWEIRHALSFSPMDQLFGPSPLTPPPSENSFGLVPFSKEELALWKVSKGWHYTGRISWMDPGRIMNGYRFHPVFSGVLLQKGSRVMEIALPDASYFHAPEKIALLRTAMGLE